MQQQRPHSLGALLLRWKLNRVPVETESALRGWRVLVPLLVGITLWLLPAPRGWVDPAGNFHLDGTFPHGARTLVHGWHVFAVFAASIVAFVLRPLPMGAVTLMALVFLAATGSLTFEQTLAGFSDATVWLVVAAFLLAGVLIQTGLGRRIALGLVVRLGRSPRGLAYAICASEGVLGALIPSNTARGGGVLFPITRSLAEALDSRPDHQPERAGAYLMTVGAHANLIAAAMYLTGMAANPLVRVAAQDVFGIDFGWGTWALGAIVPALAAFALLPMVVARLEPPATEDVRAARERARTQLASLGRWTRAEKIMCLTGAALVLLWSTSGFHGMNAALVAWIGLCVLLASGVTTWPALVRTEGAWDALIWVGGILTMANQLRDLGFIGWFAHGVSAFVQHLPTALVLIGIALVYFYSMYAFSMLTAHIAAMVAAFLTIAKTAGVAPLLAVAVLAYASDLCACLTPYSSGPVIIHFGAGYVPSARWFRNGFVISLMHLGVWGVLGSLWWKLLGWW